MNIFSMNNGLGPWLLMLLSLPLGMASCDNTIDPLQENTQYVFSIYGFLDVSVDTQWVRVMPIRDSLYLAPQPIDATVTLEHLGGGQPVALEDSLFRYGLQAYAYNFWTDLEMIPGDTYRLKAMRSDGESSSVEFTFPVDFPEPDVRILEHDVVDQIYIFGVQTLALVEVIYEVIDPSEPELEPKERLAVSQIENAEPITNGFVVTVNPTKDALKLRLRVSNSSARFKPIQVRVAAAGSDWPDFLNLEDEDLALPDVVSNVENGLGFVAPVMTKTAPYE